MSKSPFYRVSITSSGRDITEMIDSFTFEDCTEEDDILKITLKNKDVSLADDPDLSEGVFLSFVYGFLNGAQANVRSFEITDINYNYSTTFNISIVASDPGRQTKVNESNKIWKNVSTAEIIKQIADKHKLKSNVEGKTKTYTSIPQGNLSDFDFIKYLASVEPGFYISFMSSGTINFIKRKVADASSATYTYGDPEGSVIDFNVTVKKDKKDKGSGETKVSGIDPDTLEEVGNKANKTPEKTGKYIYDENSNQLNENTTGKNLGGAPVHNNADAKAVTEKAKSDAELQGITATLKTEGNPGWLANTIISMAGVAKKHSGNWYTSKVTHTINRSGYLSSGDMKKNATAQDVSNPDGTATAANKIYIYDENGNPVK